MSQYTSNFESATRALYLARLLHEYLKPLRNSTDKGKLKARGEQL
jgi:hypothetical protein